MDKIIVSCLSCDQVMTRAPLKNSILFLPAQKQCGFAEESSVLEVALRHGIEIAHSCGAMGSCTTCRVIVEESPTPLPERNELEMDIAEMRGFQENERLSCQLPPVAGLVVRVPEPFEAGARTKKSLV